MPKTNRPPAYRLHKARQCAVVTINGHNIYLGAYGSPQSHERYARLIAEWQAQHGQSLLVEAATASPTPSLAINELILRYWQHVLQHYRKHGVLTGYHQSIRSALRYLRKMYGSSQAKDFGPLALKAVRQAMIDANLSRAYINAHVDRIRRAFRWAVSEELLTDPTLLAKLASVTGLGKGRSAARETQPVRPAPQVHVDAAIPFLSRQVAAMVRLQLSCAARPGEICLLRPCDISFGTDGSWTYTPSQHKTEHEDKRRQIVLGPRAQEFLRPFLERDPQMYCFSPTEAVEARNTKRRLERRTPMTPSQSRRRPKARPRRAAGVRYSSGSYRRAVARACQRAKVPVWRPNQLRHLQASRIRECYGLEGAQVVLGHADPKVTERYAERSLALAKQVMLDLG